MARNHKRETLVYVRCKFCGWKLKGNSDKTLIEWSKHLDSCKKKHEESQ